MKRANHIVSAGALLALGAALSQSSAQAQFANPYAAFYQNQVGQQAFGGGMNNPYSPYAAGNFYSPSGMSGMGGMGGAYGGGLGMLGAYGYYNPYMYSSPGIGYGISLMGQASVMKSYGQVITSQENARVIREQANQARIDTQKKRFDLAMYIRANTPTYTQEAERVQKSILRRIQNVSLPGEVTNGKSLNVLLDDLRKHPGKKISQEPLPLSESVLTRLNVTKNTFGIGLLRDGGKLSWPLALRGLMSVTKQQDLDKQIKALVEDAYRGRLDGNALKDVTNEINKLTDVLISKNNEIPTTQYHDAKRFLRDFNDAVTGLQRGEAQVQAKYQRFIEGGKTVKELVDYMTENGLHFGPATAEDEAAYRAVYGPLASYDVAMNTALGIDSEK